MNTSKRNATTIILALLLGLSTAGCASSGSSSGPSRSRDVVTAEELATTPNRTLYEALERLRPRWLQTRSSVITSAGGPQLPRVYLDGAPQGTVETLKGIFAREVEEVRYMDGNDATTRYGTDHAGGAIMVTTRTG